MKIKILLIIIFLFFYSCKEKNANNEISVEKDFYLYSKKFNGHLSFHSDMDILVENKDSLSNLHFLKFKKDSLVFITKKFTQPPFVKDFFKLKKEFVMLNTMPRTLGKNRKSTDFLTKYDEKFQVSIKKDMDISKYPSGNSFIVGGSDKLFYITDWFSIDLIKDSRKLIISEVDELFNITNQKVLKREKDGFKYNPIKCIFIEDIGIVIVSDLSYYNGKNKKFKIDMLDLDLNTKWSEELAANSIIYFGHSKSEKKIFLISEKEKTEIEIWNYSGKKSLMDYNLKKKPLSVTSSDNNIFILNNHQEKSFITKINISEKIIDKIKTPLEIKLKEANINNLIYRDNQLFIVNIDNAKKLLTVQIVKNKL